MKSNIKKNILEWNKKGRINHYFHGEFDFPF